MLNFLRSWAKTLYTVSAGEQQQAMPRVIDYRIEEMLVSAAVGSLRLPSGKKILCSKRGLKKASLDLARDAYEVGFLAAQKEHLRELAHPGSSNRPTWMDIKLDDPEELAKHKIRFKPVVLRSFIGAGCRCVGDLRWISNRELRQLHYVGIRTAQQVKAVLRRFENRE